MKAACDFSPLWCTCVFAFWTPCFKKFPSSHSFQHSFYEMFDVHQACIISNSSLVLAHDSQFNLCTIIPPIISNSLHCPTNSAWFDSSLNDRPFSFHLHPMHFDPLGIHLLRCAHHSECPRTFHAWNNMVWEQLHVLLFSTPGLHPCKCCHC